MRDFFRNSILHIALALLAGLGLGLTYSWLISPVKYVDANPSILRADFKDQYRVVIAASYASSHDLARARARLGLLNNTDPVGELSAQAQRMLAAGESPSRVQPLAQLANDLLQGFPSTPVAIAVAPALTHTNTPSVGTPFTAIAGTSNAETPAAEENTPVAATELPGLTLIPTLSFEQTPLAPQTVTFPTPRPTATPNLFSGASFTPVGQDTICDTSLKPGLLQLVFMDSRRRQIPGIEIVVTWAKGEDHFFTGFQPEVGDGYADFIMQADTIYNIRVVQGGSSVPNISAPSCTDSNGTAYLGGLQITFQQP
jgi:hypothetical protein